MPWPFEIDVMIKPLLGLFLLMWKFPPEVSRIVRSDPLTDYRTILMTDPVTTGTGLTAGAVSVGALGWWAGLDPGVAIGAFWGAIFFVLSSKNMPKASRYFWSEQLKHWVGSRCNRGRRENYLQVPACF